MVMVPTRTGVRHFLNLALHELMVSGAPAGTPQAK